MVPSEGGTGVAWSPGARPPAPLLFTFEKTIIPHEWAHERLGFKNSEPKSARLFIPPRI